jgi:DNA-binding transcriptional MerR regulator
MLTIGEFAQATGLTAKALRLYDDLGLLLPAQVDARNGYRYYEPQQVEAARLVARLRSAGVPLIRIAAIVGAATPEAAAAELLSYWRQV